jgi:hypothetical protein
MQDMQCLLSVTFFGSREVKNTDSLKILYRYDVIFQIWTVDGHKHGDTNR